MAAILGSGCRPMSDNVDAGVSEYGITENVRVAVEIKFVAVIAYKQR